MHFTALSTALLAILHNAIAAPVDSHRPSLDVTLTRVGNTHIKAMVKNTGSEDVTFVHLNWFHDNAPVPKVSVHRNGTEVQFQGIRRRYRLDGLTSEALTSLAAGETFEDEFDIASTSDLSEGGTVSLKSHGIVPIVTDGKVSGAIPYNSNELSIDVDAAEAATVMKAIAPLDRRTKTAQCSGSKGSALNQALRNSAMLANKAADAATSGSASKFQEYFKTTSSSTRQTVAARLRAVAKESSSTTSGATTYYCSDAYGYCSSNVLAYTLPAYNIIANCDIYYTYLPPLAGTCHAQDQATTTLHEFTHAPGVYSPGTQDYGYGYQAATALSANQALNNADSYALYANAIHLGC